MAAGVLNSGRAIEVSIYVARTFVAMRNALTNTQEFSKKFYELEKRLERRLLGHDQAIADLLTAIRELMRPIEPQRRPIGFISPPNASGSSSAAKRGRQRRS
jgi:ATP-dependent Clp protease ATP-binding subunit ClpA